MFPLWLAVTLHEGSTLLVALNSLRLLVDPGPLGGGDSAGAVLREAAQSLMPAREAGSAAGAAGAWGSGQAAAAAAQGQGQGQGGAGGEGQHGRGGSAVGAQQVQVPSLSK